MCSSCGHDDASWQHAASCKPVEEKVPPSLAEPKRHIEEEVPSRVPKRGPRRAKQGGDR